MSKLTLQKLKDMKPGTIIASGAGSYSELHSEPVKWVATRGGIHDWAIYHEYSDMEIEYVVAYGEKIHTESIIKQLVPCDDEAFAMYRY